ncbi:MAG: phosphoserine phosphatase [Pseudonocardiales bacterium]|jgi:phosphoserine phosphatase|nr:phosphoserine phosphatase [Pseudonocardiales bacterium]
MDGTLLEGSACLDLSVHAGHSELIHDLEARWAIGQVGHVEFYELCVPLWKGLSDRDVDTVFDASRWIGGIEAVFADIRTRGEHAAVITLSPKFFAERLSRFGIETVYGAGVLPGGLVDESLVLTPDSKVTIARELLEQHGVSVDDCVAYGDSSSDVPLFAEFHNTVAVNATDALREAAAVTYDGHDLREAYAAGRALLGRAPQRGAC